MNPSEEFVLTRYLYNKNKIANALTDSILCHNVDESLFWAFELLFSGFETEVFYILGTIYRVHYETGNPELVNYIHNMISKWEKHVYPIEYVLLHVVLNLVCRECNPKKESPLKVHVPTEELPKYIEKYANPIIANSNLRPNKILQTTCKYSLFKENCESYEPNNQECYTKYTTNWLYYAAKSPLWKDRIDAHGGSINETTHKIIFADEGDEEKFYEKYEYEPDEQPIQIQEKCLGIKLSNILSGSTK
jgi:hypothetical protein